MRILSDIVLTYDKCRIQAYIWRRFYDDASTKADTAAAYLTNILEEIRRTFLCGA